MYSSVLAELCRRRGKTERERKKMWKRNRERERERKREREREGKKVREKRKECCCVIQSPWEQSFVHGKSSGRPESAQAQVCV